jgi:hypothetical protein
MFDIRKTREVVKGLRTSNAIVASLTERFAQRANRILPFGRRAQWARGMPFSNGRDSCRLGDTIGLAVGFGRERMVDWTHQVEPRNADDEGNGR